MGDCLGVRGWRVETVAVGSVVASGLYNMLSIAPWPSTKH